MIAGIRQSLNSENGIIRDEDTRQLVCQVLYYIVLSLLKKEIDKFQLNFGLVWTSVHPYRYIRRYFEHCIACLPSSISLPCLKTANQLAARFHSFTALVKTNES